MIASLDRILFRFAVRLALAIHILRESLAILEARLPPWAQDRDNRLLAYLLASCVVCMIALVVKP